MCANKALYPAEVPFRTSQPWAQRRRQIPCPRVSYPTPPASGHLRRMALEDTLVGESGTGVLVGFARSPPQRVHGMTGN